MWNWSRGQCLQEVEIPKSQNNSYLLSHGVGSDPSSRIGKSIKICFDKVGGVFFVLESCANEGGGGYRASLWNLNRHQRVELIN